MSFTGKALVTLLILWAAWQMRGLDMALSFLNFSRALNPVAILPDGDASLISPRNTQNGVTQVDDSPLLRLRWPPGDRIAEGPGRMRLGDLEWYWVTVASRRAEAGATDALGDLLAAQGWRRRHDDRHWEALMSGDQPVNQSEQLIFQRMQNILVVMPLPESRSRNARSAYQVTWINRPSLHAVNQAMERIATDIGNGSVALRASSPGTGTSSLQLRPYAADTSGEHAMLVGDAREDGWNPVDSGERRGDAMHSTVLAKDGHMGIAITDKMTGQSVLWREEE